MNRPNSSEELVREIVKILDSKKAIDIAAIQIKDLTTIGDYFVVASGGSNTQVKALAEEVDEKLHTIMVNIFAKAADAAERYGVAGNYVAGANIAGFEKVVEAMLGQGIV